MKKFHTTVLQAFITTTLLAFSFTFAQGSVTNQGLGFFGDMSIKIYCTFSNFIPGSNNSACNTDVLILNNRNTGNAPATSTQVVTTPVVSTNTVAQINGVINRGLESAARVVYVPVKGEKGDNGTTTIVYQTVPGASYSSPAAYINAGGNSWTNPYQTTVPGDIHSTFIHFLQTEVMRFGSIFGASAEIASVNSSTTNTIMLGFQNATGTNLTATGTVFANNLVATNSTITSATTTNLFAQILKAVNGTVDYLAFTTATGTDLQVANASTTNFSATGTSYISQLYLASSTQTNSNILSGNATLTNAMVTNATATNFHVVNCSTSNLACRGGNNTGAIVGLDAPLTLGTLNAGNVEFITGDLGFPSVTPGSVKLVIENGVAGDGNGDVRVTNNLKVGKNIVASGTLQVLSSTTLASTTVTNITGNIASFATAFISTLNILVANIATLNSVTGNINTINAKNLNATGTAYITTVFASTTSATTSNAQTLNVTGTTTLNNLNIGGRVLGHLLPSASSTYDLGSAALPWRDLYVSSSTVHIGGYGLSVVNGTLVWSGTGIQSSASSTATSSFGVVNASTTVSNNLRATNATITNATTTSLFASLFNSVSSTFTNLFFTNASGTNATATNATSTNFFAAAFKSTNTTIDKLALNAGTSTDLFATTLWSTNSSSTNSFVGNLTATIARFTNLQVGNASTTNLSATGTATFANILGTSATITNASILSGRAILGLATVTSATTTGVSYVGGVAKFNDDVIINNQLNVDGGTLYADDINERVGINTMTPITTGNVRLTVLGDIRVGSATTNGCVQRFDGGVLSGTCSSDESLKTNILDLDTTALVNKIKDLKFVSYNWNQTANEKYSRSTDTKNIGVLAQNVESLFPELVSTDDQGFKMVNITDLQWYIFASVKELISRVNGLNKEVKTEKLCIGNTCIVESDLQEFLQYKASQGGSGQVSAPAPEPTPAPAPEPVSEGETGEENTTSN